MTINGKEIITLSALLADKLTQDISFEQLQVLKLFVSQLNNDINTIFNAKLLTNSQKTGKKC